MSFPQNARTRYITITSTLFMSDLKDMENLSPMIRGATGSKFFVESYENEDELQQILVSHLVSVDKVQDNADARI